MPREIVRDPWFKGSKNEPKNHVTHEATTGPMVPRPQDEPKNHLLQVKALSKRFSLEQSLARKFLDWFQGKPPNYVQALEQVSFSVGARETVGVLGESGSGKSTLARVLMGLYAADAGDILFQGRSHFASSRQERLAFLRNVQMVFQDPFGSLDPRMNVRQILSEPLAIHGEPKPETWEERLTHALAEVGLEADSLGRYPNEFSGGQRQRIGICRALILNPLLLIADEAVSALDVSVQAQILELLMHLKSTRQLSLLFISHDVAVVRQLADTIVVLFRGRIVERLPAECLLKDAFHPYTRRLLAAALQLREGIISVEPFHGGRLAESGCCLQALCGESSDKCQRGQELVDLHPGHAVACWKAQGKP